MGEAMNNQKKDLLLTAIKLVLIAMDAVCFAYIWYEYYANNLFIPYYLRGNLAIIAVFCVVYIAFGHLYQAFDVKTNRAASLVYSHVIASFMTSITMFFLLWLLIRHMPRILPMVHGFCLWSFMSLIWAKPASMMTRKIYPPTPTVLIYDNIAAYYKGVKITKRVDWRFKVVGEISVDEGDDAVYAYLKKKKAEAVMLCGIHSSQRNDILKYCIRKNIVVYIRPNIGDYLVNSSKSLQMEHLPVLLAQRSAPSMFYAISKRLFDIVFSLLVMIVLSPVLLVTAILIKAHDGGPILYSQERLTRNGRPFMIYKFRSMRTDAEKDGVARLAQVDDDRITPIGKFIRATRIDEMPQMINILKGDMSVVGPRPERPEISAQYEEEMPEFELRLQVKAGLTGYAQVHGQYNTSPYDKLQMDLMYIAKQSIFMDLRIILETIKVVFLPESSEGIGEDEITASDREKL